MRNIYSGTCYRCEQKVEPQAGHFQRFNGKWLLQHASCAIKYRGTKVGSPPTKEKGDKLDAISRD